jgi:hypothetical protein
MRTAPLCSVLQPHAESRRDMQANDEWRAHLHKLSHGGGRVLLLGPLDNGSVPRPHKPGDGVALALHRFRVAEIRFFPSHPLSKRSLLRRRNQELFTSDMIKSYHLARDSTQGCECPGETMIAPASTGADQVGRQAGNDIPVVPPPWEGARGGS